MFGGCFLRVGEILFGDEGGGCKCVLEEGVGMCMFDVYMYLYEILPCCALPHYLVHILFLPLYPTDNKCRVMLCFNTLLSTHTFSVLVSHKQWGPVMLCFTTLLSKHTFSVLVSHRQWGPVMLCFTTLLSIHTFSVLVSHRQWGPVMLCFTTLLSTHNRQWSHVVWHFSTHCAHLVHKYT